MLNKVTTSLVSILSMLCILLMSHACYASKLDPTDSLLNLLKVVAKDTSYVELLNELSYSLQTIDPSSSYDYAEQAFELGSRLDYEYGLSRSMNLMSYKSLYERDIEKAVDLNKKALEIALLKKDPLAIAEIYNTLGTIYSSINDNERSLEFLQLALNTAEKGIDKNLQHKLLGNIGQIHLEEGNYGLAEDYFNQLNDIAKQSKNAKQRIFSLRHLGELNLKKGNYTEAQKNLRKAIKLAQLNEAEFEKGWAKMILGQAHLEQGYFDEAERELFQSLHIFSKLNYVDLQVKIYNSLLKMYGEKQEPHKVLEYGSRILEIKKETGKAGFRMDFLKDMARAFDMEGEHKKAYLTYQDYYNYQDSLFQVEKSENIVKLETAFQLERRDVENKLLKQEAETDRSKIKLRSYLSMMFLTIATLLGILLWIGLKELNRKSKDNKELESLVDERTKELKNKNEKLTALNADLVHFSYAASHDLKEPIRNVQILSSFLKKKMAEDIESASAAKDIFQNATRMDNLLNDIISFSSIIEPKQKEWFNLNKLASQVKEEIFKNSSLSLALVNMDELPKVYGIKNNYKQILKNLIENGIKYNDSPVPEININYTSDENNHYFIVSEIVKKSITEMEGTITCENSDMGGAKFSITLPKSEPEKQETV